MAFFSFFTLAIQAVFDYSNFQIAIEREGTYIAGTNFWHSSLTPSFSTGVPLDKKRVEQLGEFLFQKGPRHLPEQTIAVASKTDDLESCKGSWKRISPEEVAHSLVFFLGNRLKNGPKLSDEEESQWLSVMLSTTTRFEKCDGDDDQWWRSYALRQQCTQIHDTVTRNAIQQAYEVVSFKLRKESEIGDILQVKDVQAQFYY